MASQATASFSQKFREIGVFDGRAFNVPESEIVNCFLWRTLDWQRNSVQMYAQSLFSHEQLHLKTQVDMHEMLHEIGKNWTTDLTDRQKNGIFIERDGSLNTIIKPNYSEISTIVIRNLLPATPAEREEGK